MLPTHWALFGKIVLSHSTHSLPKNQMIIPPDLNITSSLLISSIFPLPSMRIWNNVDIANV